MGEETKAALEKAGKSKPSVHLCHSQMATPHLGSNEGQKISQNTQAGEFHQPKPAANYLL